ncbi:MAG: hypothetical protein FD187_2360 [bacterium]|nr:MAG: hypothetical protein FD142_1003 [bacterium]KAF0147929.1 MAG: hypothetical protein FD187_2360 [bacterium]KAF0168111.1 MAG: hypothetical protein FD158_1659 [bacterium]TXT22570.1 MAG: hypothetical protein FD132_380 [bacterium]
MQITQADIAKFVEKLPGFQSMVAEQAAQEQAAKARLRQELISGAHSAIADAAKAEKTVPALEAKVKTCQQALEAANAALWQAQGQIAQARGRESNLLTRLVTDPDLGETDLETAIGLVDSGLRGLAPDIAEARLRLAEMGAQPGNWWASPPPREEVAKAQAELRDLTAEATALERALDGLTRLRLSALDPVQLRERVTSLMAGAGIHRQESGGWTAE